MNAFGKIQIMLMLILMQLLAGSLYAQKPAVAITSPDKRIEVMIVPDSLGQLFYSIKYRDEMVLKRSKLGLIMGDEDFSKGLSMFASSKEERVTDNYQMLNAKRKNCGYKANKKTLHFRNSFNQHMDIIFQVSDDGVGFRYFFPGKSTGIKNITEEVTSYHFPSSARAWLQPMQVAKTGWESTNPAYEEHYQQNMNAGTSSPSTAGWIFPAFFKYNNTWLLITEAALDSNYCASRLKAEAPDAEYSIGFPDPREVFTGKGYLPQAKLPFYSPWRIITIGNLKTIVESTLGTDLAKPAIKMDQSFIKPGKASWSWIMSKDDYIVYDEQKKYIDFAADMKWQYCLVDVDWDRKIGYDKMNELCRYAAAKNVGVLVWYNSAGDWNTVKYTPKSKLLIHEDRMKEFGRLKEIGVKGVKIDFFGGDGQSVIKYYLDILHDAAASQLLVNFHGATLPRGWARTYPHLMTMEAIRGFEFITFNQTDADAAPAHCAMLPFTRNTFDPMDFTPMNLYKIPTKVQRKTTSAFELATSILFLSGIQHYAESPEGMSHIPGYVKQFLSDLPAYWDDVKFIDGFPGRYVVLARRSGRKWYVAGINAENSEKKLHLNLSSLGKRNTFSITDGSDSLFTRKTLQLNQFKNQITMKPLGGFVMVLE